MMTTTLPVKTLGNSDLSLTAIGVGAWAMGGPDWSFAWGPQEDADSIAAIHAASDHGINWIDTAPVYGLGHSEEVVAEALEGVSERPYVFTKCGRIWDENGKIGKSLRRDSIRREIEDSLRRLRLDVIDLYQMHWPEPDEQVEEGWETMLRLREEGKVRWIGASNFSASQMRRALDIGPITSLQPPYSLVTRDADDQILPFAEENGIGVIVYSPMQSGLLTGKMTKERVANFPESDHRRLKPYFQEPQLSRNLGLADKLQEIGARHGRPAGEAAIAWTLANPAVTAAIVGMRSAEQVDGIIGAATFRLSAEELAEIDRFRQELGE